MLSKRGLPDTEHFFKKTYLNVRTRLGFGSGLPSTLLLLKLAMPSCFHNKKNICIFFIIFPHFVGTIARTVKICLDEPVEGQSGHPPVLAGRVKVVAGAGVGAVQPIKNIFLT